MRKFDRHEEQILKELIKNPRISDNQIAKNTRIPVTSVNRKRKLLEEEGFIHYYTDVSDESLEKGQHNARQLYIIKFKEGITRQKYIEEIKKARISGKSIQGITLKAFWGRRMEGSQSYLSLRQKARMN